jgi:hypothetical protein
MPIDRTVVNSLAEEQADSIESLYGDTVKIAEAVIVVMVEHPNGYECRVRFSGTPFSALGLLNAAETIVSGSGTSTEEGS